MHVVHQRPENFEVPDDREKQFLEKVEDAGQTSAANDTLPAANETLPAEPATYIDSQPVTRVANSMRSKTRSTTETV